MVDYSGKQINAIDKEGNSLPEPGNIQIDVFVGDREWMRDFVSGAPKESSYKAVYRNILLAAMFSKLRWSMAGNPSMYFRYILNPRKGLKQRVLRDVPGKKKPEIVSDEFVSTDANEIAAILFGDGVTWSDINSFEKLWALYNSSKFTDPEMRDSINAEFAKSLQRAGKELPKELGI